MDMWCWCCCRCLPVHALFSVGPAYRSLFPFILLSGAYGSKNIDRFFGIMPLQKLGDWSFPSPNWSEKPAFKSTGTNTNGMVDLPGIYYCNAVCLLPFLPFPGSSCQEVDQFENVERNSSGYGLIISNSLTLPCTQMNILFIAQWIHRVCPDRFPNFITHR